MGATSKSYEATVRARATDATKARGRDPRPLVQAVADVLGRTFRKGNGASA
jgi:hypothetical protein